MKIFKETSNFILPKDFLPIGFLCFLSIIFFYLNLAYPREEFNNFWLHNLSQTQKFILLEIRLPRVLIAFAAGMALALSGTILQNIMRNPLASPDIIGINAGACLGVVVLLIFFPQAPALLGAAIGALSVLCLLSFNISKNSFFGDFTDIKTILLSGIAITAFCSALINFFISFAPQQIAQNIQIILSGSLANSTWHDVLLLYSLILLLPLLIWIKRMLAYINLGEDIARSLGIPVKSAYFVGLTVAMVFSIFSVMIVGPINFIALIAPQIAKKIFIPQNIALFSSMLIGGLLLLIADFITILIPSSGRLPAGLITSFIGGGYFMKLIYKELRKQ